MRKTMPETIYAGNETAELFSELLHSGAVLRVRVTGTSMGPLIRSGDIVSVRKTPFATLGRGDIVLFINTDGSYMAHRILRKQTKAGRVFVHTKGDAQVEYDPWVPADKILGKIYKVEKRRSNRPLKILDLETIGWQTGGRLIALIQIAISKVALAARARLG